jgi:hypothetical protein
MRRALLSLLLLSLLQTAVVSAAYASLGGTPSQFSNATPQRQGARSLAADDTVSTVNYSITESTLDTGTVVREYADNAGLVFAVSWSGPVLPDLKTLLGGHFDTMSQEAARQPRAGHSQLALDRSDIVIVSSGHMRSFSGRAWIPSALPAGFSTDSIE